MREIVKSCLPVVRQENEEQKIGGSPTRRGSCSLPFLQQNVALVYFAPPVSLPARLLLITALGYVLSLLRYALRLLLFDAVVFVRLSRVCGIFTDLVPRPFCSLSLSISPSLSLKELSLSICSSYCACRSFARATPVSLPLFAGKIVAQFILGAGAAAKVLLTMLALVPRDAVRSLIANKSR